MDHNVEMQMAHKLLALSEAAGKNLKKSSTFEGFPEDVQDLEATGLPEGDLPEKDERTLEASPVPTPKSPPKTKKAHIKDGDIRLIVEQVIGQLAPMIQTFCVNDRVHRAESESDSWKQVANVLAKNPNLRNDKWAMAKAQSLQPMAEKFPFHPNEQTLEQFMLTPVSAPLWTISVKLNIPPMSAVFAKWWKKVNSDSRTDAWRKLARYIQSLRYFNAASDQFWSQMSTNPTYWSIQKIAVDLTFQANWLKSAGLDLQDIQHQYYDAASKIAQSQDAKVETILEALEGLWPAGFKPVQLHYEGEPFRKTHLFAQDDSSLCVKIARPKGLRAPQSLFKTTAAPAEGENGDFIELTPVPPELQTSSSLAEIQNCSSMAQLLDDFIGSRSNSYI